MRKQILSRKRGGNHPNDSSCSGRRALGLLSRFSWAQVLSWSPGPGSGWRRQWLRLPLLMFPAEGSQAETTLCCTRETWSWGVKKSWGSIFDFYFTCISTVSWRSQNRMVWTQIMKLHKRKKWPSQNTIVETTAYILRSRAPHVLVQEGDHGNKR